VHIAYLALKEHETYQDRLEYALSTVQVAAYNSSERLLKKLLLMEPPDLTSYLLTIELLGFTYWGKRRYSQALSTYLTILKLHGLLLSEWKAVPDKEIANIISGVAREYLEVLLEIVNNERDNEKRRAVVRSSKAEHVKAILEKAQFDLNYYLNRIALLEITYWLGIPTRLNEIRSYFNQCMAMQEWEAAALAAQFMLTLSYEAGQKAAQEILQQLRKRKSSKLIIKVNARMTYERLNRRVPVQILNFKAFTDILLIAVEMFFALKRFLWNTDRWLDQVRVETSFISFGKLTHKPRPGK